MPVALAEVLPIMRGPHFSQAAVGAALERLAPRIIAYARSLAPDGDRADFARDVFVALGLAILRKQGLGPPKVLPRGDNYQGWLLVRVRSLALDLARKRRRETRHETSFEALAEADAGVTAAPAEDAQPEETGLRSGRAGDVWEKLRESGCPPNYRLALFAWYWPAQLVRDDLEALAERTQRGKHDQASGLVRPVARAWPLLDLLRQRRPQGIARCGPAEDRFAWIVRSETPKFGAWAEDRRELRKARETVGKWHLRGRRWLEERRADAVADEASA